VGAAEAALVDQWRTLRAQGHEGAARAVAQFLLEANASLVGRCTRRYRLSRLTADDLAQAGQLGLLQAMERFDPERGGFAACAAVWVRKEAQRCLAAGEFPIAVPSHLPGRLVALRAMAADGPAEAARRLQLSPGIVEALRRVVAAHVGLSAGEEAGGGASVAGSSPEEVGEAGDVARGVARAVRALPEELRQVVKLRYGLDGGGERSARHVGRLLGISDFTVRMRLARARARLSRALDGFA